MKSMQILISLLVLSVLTACAGAGTRGSGDIMSTLNASSGELSPCPDAIDRGKTYQVFFRLEKETRCIRVSVIAQFHPDEFTTKMRVAKTYFTVDRMIDISSFNKKRNSLFTEMGRNFTGTWDQQRDATVCASITDPLQKLDSQSTYRIRIATFEKDNYQFQVIIHADEKVQLMKELMQ
ncbi:MAG: hypothetical protein CVV44_15380 [Spirochaetae bacterium HGW-Spirochaetae-1]|nr:MAG: hypothetical protein CVV44_15380 [Spirochaetae bacterium HGW-Spirochaetae-1]